MYLLELADAPARGLLFDPPRPETSGQPVSTRVRRIAAIKSEFGVEIIPPHRVTLALEIIQFVIWDLFDCDGEKSGGPKQSNIGGPSRQINDPSPRKYFSLPFLPATPLSPPQTLDSPRVLLLELQRYKDVRCVVLSGMEVPRHCNNN